jgi:NADPH:quinone reductase-like Zn-dependent oxidoreductase
MTRHEMRSFHIRYGGGLDSLTLRVHPTPSPGPGQVLVAMRANSLNAREINILRGRYPLPVKPELIPASDGAGDVVAVGPGVTGVRPGDRVMGVVFRDWLDGRFDLARADQLGGSLDGMLTEYALLAEHGVVSIPEQLSYEEAATLPCAAVTAWNALFGGQGVRAGQTVLTLGTGSVSLFALRLAKVAGAEVIATAGGADRAARMAALGADHVIDRHASPDWPVLVRDLTGGRGVDHVIEVAGTLNQSLRALSTGGEVAFVGTLGGPDPIDPGLLFTASAVVRSIALGTRAMFLDLNRAITANGLSPVIDRVFPFDETAAAFRHVQDGRPFGKVVITH